MQILRSWESSVSNIAVHSRISLNELYSLVYEYHFIEYPKEEGTEVIHEFIQEMKDKERQRIQKERAERLLKQQQQSNDK